MVAAETVAPACSGQRQETGLAGSLQRGLRRISKLCCRRVAKERETAVKQALWQLANDFLSAILFLVVYVVSGSLLRRPALLLPPGWRNSSVSRWRGAGSSQCSR